MLIPDSFQCLVVVRRSALGEFGCIRSRWVAPCEFGCTPGLLNRAVSTWLHRVNSLSPRTGVYVVCTLLFGCMECSWCIRVQAIFFADVLKCHGIKVKNGHTRTPQTQRLVEEANGTMKTKLCAWKVDTTAAGGNSHCWTQALPEISLAMNCQGHSSLDGHSPYEVMFNRKPRWKQTISIAARAHQQKNTLRQIRRRCALMQATLLLRSLRPVRPEFRRNARKHPVFPGLLGHALSILTGRRVVLVPWLRFYSLLSHDGASFTLSLPRALTYFSLPPSASAPQFRISRVQGKLASTIMLTLYFLDNCFYIHI